MTTLFVSDLHLDAARPDKLELFRRFIEHASAHAEALYILGDLFEVWVGDDDDTPAFGRIIDALNAASRAGVRLGIAHGNRDFLFGRRFAAASGAELLPDFALIDLYGRRTLLTHGDLLCTRDVKYQKFRRVVRNPVVRGLFLAAPLSWRKRIALKTQSGTRASMARKDAGIMDVEPAAVTAAMAAHNAELLIHGHTHRPGIHDAPDGTRRIVLGDWYEQDSVLVCRDDGHAFMRVNDYLDSAAEQIQPAE